MEGTYLALSFEEQEAIMMVARKDDNGVITPIEVESRRLNLPLVCGIVPASEKVNITMLTRTLANKIANMDIKGIYIGSCLRSMRSQLETVNFTLNGKKTVTANDEELLNAQIENLVDKNTIKTYESVKRRDGIEVANIIGEIASNIEKECIFVKTAELYYPKYRDLLPPEIDLRGIEPIPVAKAYATTSEEQRISGCMVIDVMSDMTSFTLFKDNALRGTAVVPFGFNDILHDAHKEGLVEKELKALLTKHWEYPTVASNKPWTIEGKQIIFSNDDIFHINSRIEEILNYGKDWAENILLLSEVRDNIIVTGLLSDRPGFVKLVGNILEGKSHEGKLSLNVTDDKYCGPKYWSLLGIINAADKCCVIDRPVIESIQPISEPAEPQKTTKTRTKTNLIDGVRDLFSNLNGEEKD